MASEVEKGDTPSHLEMISDIKSGSTTQIDLAMDPILERRVIRKCDLHVVPILTLLFLFAFLDRINIGNARLLGLEEDLSMEGRQYNVALFVFFILYILLEVPSNMVLKKIKPSWWLSGIMAGWGIVTICQGVTRSFGGLVACRVIIGGLEAGFMPGLSLPPFYNPSASGNGADFWIGSVYLINMYYRRHELQRRLNFFFSASIFAGAVSGV